MGHGAAVVMGALVPVASTDSGAECGWDCMADKRLVYRKYTSFFCEKQMKRRVVRQIRFCCKRLILCRFSFSTLVSSLALLNTFLGSGRADISYLYALPWA
jgi:hypothetical protein